MRVVVAPDKFKGSLSAAQVAAALAAGIGRSRPEVDVVRLPVADGGDGTLDAAVSAGYERVRVRAPGPTGRVGPTSYAVKADQAVVELAAVVGLGRLPGGRLDPLGASTYGLGVVIAEAVRRGAGEVVLGLGGSASTDGGVGMIQALGGRVLDRAGRNVPAGGGHLSEAVSLDLRAVREAMRGIRLVVASDVDIALLGERGAAAVFGPQKGAGPVEVALLEHGLASWARLVAAETAHDEAARPGAGAAGGTAFAALAILGATLRPGIEVVLDVVGFRRALTGADLVVTGEGSLDDQSLAGKAPIGVARAARAAGVRVVAVAGRCNLAADQLTAVGISAGYQLSDLEPDEARSKASAEPLLSRVGERIAADWLS